MHEAKRRILALARHRNLSEMTLREIGQHIGILNPSGVSYHLHQLLHEGLLKKERNQVIHSTHSEHLPLTLVSVPILGSANCGEATIFAEDVVEGFLRVSAKLINPGKRWFAVRAVGNSMNAASIDGSSIEEGDYVIIDATDRVPRSGDYIVAILDGLANIKLFVEDAVNGSIALLSQSTEEHPPIFLHEDDKEKFFVAGKVKTVLKKPRAV